MWAGMARLELPAEGYQQEQGGQGTLLTTESASAAKRAAANAAHEPVSLIRRSDSADPLVCPCRVE
jgi:hypothetical protein